MAKNGDRVVAALARPREAGSAGAAAAREIFTAELTGLGYQVEVQRFSFAPGALNAFPIFGAGLGWLILVIIPLLMLPGIPRGTALAAWLGGLLALGAVVRGVGLGWAGRGGTLREDANLIATRPGARVTRWIVAHTDTKAQGHSMAGRLVAVWVAIVAVLGVTALGVLRLGGPVAGAYVAAAAGAGLAAGVLAGRGRLRGESPGARDNGSGVVAVLGAAAQIQDPGVGILLTGAEEFGLVGARILASTRPELIRDTDVVNVDTVDERGAVAVVSHDAAGRAVGRQLLKRLTVVASPVRERRLPLGIFVDSYPLARAGARAVTIARLDWSTLRLIHTPRDTAEGFPFESARRVGRVLAEWARE